MRIVVQKFGGTSLATAALRDRVCDVICRTLGEDVRVVVVVSAMGREKDPYATDTLINLVKASNPCPHPRELDLMMSCGEMISGVVLATQLAARGINTRFLTGERSGLVTDDQHGNAHILYINPRSILECFEQGVVPVVAGFQGISEAGEITTLGRGGSDTTASALGVALNADFVDIFTDVEGVMTADPRIVDNARLLHAITYNEICQLARDGAKVVHPRAVEIAMQGGIPLRVRSTFSDSNGTLVTHRVHDPENRVSIIRDRLITGVTYTSSIAQIRIGTGNIEEAQGLELNVFKSLAQTGISVDFITVQPGNILFTVPLDSAGQACTVLESIGVEPSLQMDCAKVAIVGAAMTGIPGVMARVVEALTEQGIPILQSGDSYTNIWCLVSREYMEKAVKALHDKFELYKK